MSRPTWHCEIKLTLVNGVSGAVHLDARDLLTMREVKEQFAKALRMAETLCAEAPAAEEKAERQWPRAVS